MSKPLQLISISALLATAILGIIYLPEIQQVFLEDKNNLPIEQNDLTKAKQLLDLSRPLEAAALAKSYSSEIEKQSPTGKKWLEIFTQASEDIPDPDQLLLIFQHHPSALEGHEKAALMVANALIAHKDVPNYLILREHFKDRSSAPWFILDADSLVLQNKPEEAIQLLKSRYYEGGEDTQRLLRLALLNFNEHPKYAWDFLEQAQKKDPENYDIRLYRARLLETSDKKNLAEAEYSEAGRKAKNDPKVQEELADFYLRHHLYKKALAVLQKNLIDYPSGSSTDSIWIKTIFLSKAVQPIPYNFQEHTPPEGREKSIVKFLTSLPADQFWVETNLPIPSDEQAIFWLRVLQNLKDGRERDALTLIENNTFQNSLWDPELAEALASVILYRASGDMPKNLHFLEKLGHGSLVDLLDNLKGPDGFATLFAARGWNEAALQFHSLRVTPNTTPEWIAPAITQALRENRGAKEAIAFAMLQKKSPSLDLALADLYLLNGDSKQGEELLKGLSYEPNDAGKKAAWQYAVLQFNRNETQHAKEILKSQPELEKSVRGQELLARIALKEHKPDEAAKIYEGVQDASSEARSYLAKKAFLDKDYRAAFVLTELLLKENPKNTTLKDNLQKILTEIQKN